MNFCRKMDVIERIKLYQIIKAKTCSMNELIFIVIIEFYTNRCFNKNLLYRENLIFMMHRILDFYQYFLEKNQFKLKQKLSTLD